MSLGSLQIHDDWSYGAKKITYHPPTLSYAISQQVLEKDPLMGLGTLAKQFSKMIEQNVLEHLLKVMQHQSPQLAMLAKKYGLKDATYSEWKKALYEETAASGSWNDPETDVTYQIIKAMENFQAAPAVAPSGTAVLSTLRKVIPGLKGAKASCPANEKCAQMLYTDFPLDEVIIHLNDHHKWPREQIADWLETLDVDLSFQAPEEPAKEPETLADLHVNWDEMKFDSKYDDKIDALLYAAMSQPLLNPEDAFKIINEA